MTLRPSPVLFPVLSTLVLVACREIPAPYHLPTLAPEVIASDTGLSDVRPIDIAIVPVQIAETGTKSVPDRFLREAAAHALVAQRYSPLSLAFVDAAIPGAGGVVEASYRPGTLAEDAVLTMVAHKWDASRWLRERVLDVDLEFFIESPEAGGRTLWTARLAKRFDLKQAVRLEVNEDARLARATQVMLDEVCSALPTRQAAPGR